jgi:hypothetical protein
MGKWILLAVLSKKDDRVIGLIQSRHQAMEHIIDILLDGLFIKKLLT